MTICVGSSVEFTCEVDDNDVEQLRIDWLVNGIPINVPPTTMTNCDSSQYCSTYTILGASKLTSVQCCYQPNLELLPTFSPTAYLSVEGL